MYFKSTGLELKVSLSIYKICTLTDFIIVFKRIVHQKKIKFKDIIKTSIARKKTWKNIFLKHFVNMFYIPQKESHPGAARGKIKQQNIQVSSL